MKAIFKTTLATAFAAACLAGASVSFAADNGGNNDGKNNPGSGISSNPGMNNNDSDMLQTDPSQTNSITKCDNNAANQQNCMQPNQEQQQ